MTSTKLREKRYDMECGVTNVRISKHKLALSTGSVILTTERFAKILICNFGEKKNACGNAPGRRKLDNTTFLKMFITWPRVTKFILKMPQHFFCWISWIIAICILVKYFWIWVRGYVVNNLMWISHLKNITLQCSNCLTKTIVCSHFQVPKL